MNSSSLKADYEAVLDAGTAASTKRAYIRDLKYFNAWHRATFTRKVRLPVPVDTLLRFILDHNGKMDATVDAALVNAGHKRKPGPITLRSIRRYLSSLSVHHNEKGIKNPVRDERVRLLLRRAQRARATERPHQKTAITADILKQMIATCDDSLHGKRDRAILLVGFASGGRRRSELANLRVEDLVKVKGGYVITVRASKTDQSGVGHEVPILGEAATALKSWLLASGLRSGPLFRGILPNNMVSDSICGRTINRIVKQRIELIGLDSTCFGAHSLRAGFITEAGRRGKTLGDAMDLSGHRDSKVAGSYYRRAALLGNSVGTMLDNVN